MKSSYWKSVVAGFAAVLGSGAVLSFGVFSQPLQAAFNWSGAQADWCFAVALAAFGMGALIGGYLTDQVGPRTVGIAGAILWGMGNILAGLFVSISGVIGMYAFYGVVGGIGAGFVFIAALTSVMRWSSARRGFGGGLLVMCWAFGAFLYEFIVNHASALPTFAPLAAQYVAERAFAESNYLPFDSVRYALKPEQIHALTTTFVVSGFIFLIISLTAAFMLTVPAKIAESLGGETSSGAMLRTPQFYILLTMFFLNITAGLVITTNANHIASELTALKISDVAAVLAIVPLFNGLGSMFWGVLSDRIGRSRTFAILLGVQVVTLFLISFLHVPVPIAMGLGVIFACFGGGFGVMPAYIADTYGLRNFGRNYGLTLGFAFLIAPLAALGFVQLATIFTNSYVVVQQPAAIILLIAIIFPLISDRTSAGPSTRRPKALVEAPR